MAEPLVWPDEAGATAAVAGLGLTCSAVTSRRFKAVPSGVQVIKVTSGFVVGYTSELTSVGLTTLVRVTL